MHRDQLVVSVETVRRLIRDQFPEWDGLPVREIASQGTVNAIYRVGERMAARFSLQKGEVEATRQWLVAEAEAARELLGRTRVPTPEPLGIGMPGPGYPLPWSVQSWIAGTTAAEEDPGGSTTFARDLAEFLHEVRSIGRRGRSFSGRGRGGDLRSHDPWMQTCFRESGHLLDVPGLQREWTAMRDLPRGHRADTMTHGDLIPGNVLVADGRLAGVLDVGGLGPADPAVDLVCAWHLLDALPRRVLRDELGCDDLEWARGRAWAFEQAMGLVWYYVDSNPAMSVMGRRTLDRILADDGVH